MQPAIQRDGTWWQQDPEGRWHRWDAATNAWTPVAGPPPPPPAPRLGTHPPTPHAGLPTATTAHGWPPDPTAAPNPTLATSTTMIPDAPASRSEGLSRKWLVGAAVLVVLAAAGGGYMFMNSGDKPQVEATSAQAPTAKGPGRAAARKVGIATQIERLCRATEARTKALMPPADDAEMNELLAATKSFSVKARKLDPPKRFAPMLTHFDRGVALLEEGFRTATRMDPVIARMEAAQAAGDHASVQTLMAEAQRLGNESGNLLRSGGRELQRSSRAARAVGIDC